MSDRVKKKQSWLSVAGWSVSGLVLLLILLGLLFPAGTREPSNPKLSQSKFQLNRLVNAVKAFYSEYGRYPIATEASRDITFTDDNATLINVLTANVSAPMAMADNPRKIMFMEIPKAEEGRGGLLEDGTYVDPWGFPYRIRMDTNYDGQVANPAPTKGDDGPVKTGVIAWSWGKDGKRGESERGIGDVVSWR